MRHLTAPPLRAVHSSALHVVGAGSYALRARPEDDGAMWPALAVRCRRALPGASVLGGGAARSRAAAARDLRRARGPGVLPLAREPAEHRAGVDRLRAPGTATGRRAGLGRQAGRCPAIHP